MIRFLELVRDRAPLPRGPKPKNGNAQTEGMNLNTQVEVNDQAGDRGKTISASSFDAYICALMDLWKTQHELGRNPVVPIRPSSVKTMQKAKKIAQVSQEDLEFADRGIGTIADRVKLND